MDGRLIAGRYRLLESHAVGGMASVWRAVDESTGTEVAVKRLHPHLVADPEARERFLREGAAMGTVRHPNVVHILDAVVDDEPALVMELVPGKSLADLLADDRRFDEDEAAAIAADVADGLSAVHQRGIIHRDVKPGNVLIGDDGRARLTDFGIAQSLDDTTALTRADGVVGTLRYLAPERLAGEPADVATDVWGVGAILYEMIAGTPAFPHATLADRVSSASEPVERPRRVPPELWEIIRRCLEPDAKARFADAATLATALRELPGVPPALALAADPGAATELMTAIHEAPARPREPRPASAALLDDPIRTGRERLEGLLAALQGPRREPRLVGAILSAALVFLLAAAFLDGRQPAGATAPQPAPTATPTPVLIEQPLTLTPAADGAAPREEKPGDGSSKGNGGAKGKGKGRGG